MNKGKGELYETENPAISDYTDGTCPHQLNADGTMKDGAVTHGIESCGTFDCSGQPMNIINKGLTAACAAAGCAAAECCQAPVATCTCDRGTAALGPACTESSASTCTSCDEGFVLRLDAGSHESCPTVEHDGCCSCFSDEVGTPNGRWDNGQCCGHCTDLCHDNANKVGTCVANKCTCDGGTTATGFACTHDGAAICTACDEGFVLHTDNVNTDNVNACVYTVHVSPGNQYVGCFADNTPDGNGVTNRDLPIGTAALTTSDRQASLDECASQCAGYKYMGLQWTSGCWCGNEYGSQGTAECPETCGLEECTTLTIGTGPVVGQTFPVVPGYTCPAVVNRDNWLNVENYGDKFAVTQGGASVSVSRTDTGNSADGWGLNLQFKCCGETPSMPTPYAIYKPYTTWNWHLL
jgi:hypothetical protein